MNFCEKCGAALPPGTMFCPNCGHPRPASTPPVPGPAAYPPVSAPPPYPAGPPPYLAGPPYPPPPGGPVPADPARRGRGGLITWIVLGTVAVVALGAGGYVLLNDRSSGDAQNALWAQYFYPSRVGYTCTYESSLDTGFGSTAATQTQSVTSVDSISDGIRIRLHSVTETEFDFDFPTDFPTDLFPTGFPTDLFPTDFPTDLFPTDFPTDLFPTGFPIPTLDPDDMPDLSDLPPTTTELDLTYIITGDGTLKSPPLGFSDSGLLVQTSEFLTLPSIEDLRTGRSVDSTMSISAKVAELEEVLGSDELAMTFTLHVEAAEPETIETQAGTYTDVVGVTVSFSDVRLDTTIPGLTDQMELFEGMLDSFLPETTSWYARGVGPVRTDIQAFMITTSSELTGCTG